MLRAGGFEASPIRGDPDPLGKPGVLPQKALIQGLFA
jgi:hypothetical protein